jgi:hypothetical protein
MFSRRVSLRYSLSLLLCGLALSAARRVSGQGVNVLTFHYDNARLGWNRAETQLTPAAVRPGAFGKLWHAPLDGFVPGSPLYVSELDIGGQRRAVVFAGTDHNSVFALDAASGRILWERRRLREPLTDAQFSGSWFGDDLHGILSTPVIDLETRTLYTCVVRAKGFRQLFEVWALDIRTGETRPGWPIVLKGAYRGSPFVGGQVMQRGALMLVEGWVYVPFGGRGDIPPWRGWLIGVDTRRPSAPQRAFCSSPVTDGAGIWSGGGVSSDDAGALFTATGNGDFDLFKGGANLAQSVLRLTTAQGRLGFSGQPPDYYTPANYKYLDEQDEDLGGATALVLPDQPDTSTPRLLFTGGKDGLAYLLNRDNLGGIGGEVQKFRLFGDINAVYHEGIRSTSAYFDAGEKGRFLFVAGDQPGPENALGLAALQLTAESPGSTMRMKRVWTLKQPVNGPSSPVVSSQGSANGILWLVETNDGERSSLRAYDALSGAELYNSNAGSPNDRFDGGRRFTSPIVADGRVFIGAQGVLCFSLLPRSATEKGEGH